MDFHIFPRPCFLTANHCIPPWIPTSILGRRRAAKAKTRSLVEPIPPKTMLVAGRKTIPNHVEIERITERVSCKPWQKPKSCHPLWVPRFCSCNFLEKKNTIGPSVASSFGPLEGGGLCISWSYGSNVSPSAKWTETLFNFTDYAGMFLHQKIALHTCIYVNYK